MMEGAFGTAERKRDLTSIKRPITSAFVLTHTQIMRSNSSGQQPIAPLRPTTILLHIISPLRGFSCFYRIACLPVSRLRKLFRFTNSVKISVSLCFDQS